MIVIAAIVSIKHPTIKRTTIIANNPIVYEVKRLRKELERT